MMTELFSDVKGPIPGPGSTLFQGMVFLVTHVEKTEAQKREERALLKRSRVSGAPDTSLDDSTMTEGQI